MVNILNRAMLHRDIVVLRHIKGDNRLFIYSSYQPSNSNASRFAETISASRIINDTGIDASTSLPITLGAVKFTGGGYVYYGKGVIHWCKVWYDDLGASNAESLATWCRETLRMEYYTMTDEGGSTNSNIYWLAGESAEKSKMSFIANNLLGGRGYYMNPTNTNEGGWASSQMRAFCNDRFFNGLPVSWRAMIQAVKVYSTKGLQSKETQFTEDKIYLAANKEIGGYTTEGYNSESDARISWFTADKYRLKFKGKIIPEDAQIYTSSNDPTADVDVIAKPGDIWVNASNSNYGYMYYAQDELDALNLTPTIAAASGEGGWILADYWWERSPNVSGSTNFMSVYIYGTPHGSGSAYNVYGVCPCFSI